MLDLRNANIRQIVADLLDLGSFFLALFLFYLPWFCLSFLLGALVGLLWIST